ncbi:MAG: NAD(P)H-binding protein, partial [Bacteroidota bacterium]
MTVLITGATGFVGRGVLMEALEAPEVTRVVSLGRSKTGVQHPKLAEWLAPDMGDLSGLADQLVGLDACFWCLGVSSNGMDEARYTEITHAYTLHAATLLHRQNPTLHFCFVSGSGADGNAMWAKVKKRTEDDLKAAGFPGVTVFRPAYIEDRHGAELRGTLYRVAYRLLTFASPIIRRMGGGTSNAEIGRAMIV